jgi:hypothetical protein
VLILRVYQIWFQNRRQNDRRKSRPLSPQEIAALRYGGGPQISLSDPVSSGPHEAADLSHETRAGDDAAPASDRPLATLERGSSRPSSQSSSGLGQLTSIELQRAEESGPEAELLPSSQRSESEGESQALSQSMSSSVGYLSNRWNAGNTFSAPSSQGRHGDDSSR